MSQGVPRFFMGNLYGCCSVQVVATGLAMQVLREAMQIGLVYLGAGALLWLVILILALVMR
jgi:hypothetical protein